MYTFLARNGVLMGFLLAVLCIVVMFIPILTGIDAFESLPDKVNDRAVSPEGNIFNAGIYIAVGLLILTTLATIILSIWGIFTDFKSSKKGLIGFGILIVLFFILYATSGDMSDVPASMAATVNNPNFGLTNEVFKWINGAITGTIWMLIAAFILLVVMEIWNFFKTA